MDVDNIFFVIAFIALPIVLGVWALVSRRDLARRGLPTRRGAIAPPQLDVQRSAEAPQRDWASHVRPVRQETTRITVNSNRRQFYPPRYAGRSAGVVKRVTPRAARSFLRARSGN